MKSFSLKNNLQNDSYCGTAFKKVKTENLTNTLETSINDARTIKKHYYNPQFEKMEVQGQQSSKFISIDHLKPEAICKPWTDTMFEYSGCNHIRINRARFYDWCTQVCFLYNLSWTTFYFTVAILDRMIRQKGNITVSNITLYGTVSLFIAAKYIQGEPLITLDILYSQINFERYSKSLLICCQAQIFSWLCLSNKKKAMHFPTLVDRVYDVFPGVDEQNAKKILLQLFYVIQQPNSAIGKKQIVITQNRLIQQVGYSVLNGYRYGYCDKIEQFYLDHYACLNARRYCMKIKI